MRVDLPAVAGAGNWEVLFEARLPDACTAPQGIAMTGGLYMYGTNFAEKTVKEFSSAEFSAAEYRLYSLGQVKFFRDMQIYFGGLANPAIPEMLIGRMFLRRIRN